MLLVYSENYSARLTYILKFLFKEVMGCDFRQTTNAEQIKSSNEPKINYSSRQFENCVCINPSGLIFENDIHPLQPDVFDFEDTKAFFKTESSDFPFDIFAASFFLLSRYEEYLPFQADIHGRFTAASSLSFKNNFLGQPTVDLWAIHFRKVLLSKFPSLKFKERSYSFCATIDVDNVFACSGKGFFRTLGAFLKSLLKFDFNTIFERSLVLSGRRKDPFDRYELHEQLANQYKIDLIYFLLFGSRSRNDHNVSPQNHKYKNLTRYLATFAELGIHPSYQSNSESLKMASEIKSLESSSTKKIFKSRQHFLKMKMPATYRALIQNGITEDYSMGYASTSGFRASTCTPFYFFDLAKNEETSLKLFPFSVMDMAFADYMKISPAEALKEIESVINEVKKVNGLFIPVWHDRAFSERHYPGWSNAFEEMIKLATA